MTKQTALLWSGDWYFRIEMMEFSRIRTMKLCKFNKVVQHNSKTVKNNSILFKVSSPYFDWNKIISGTITVGLMLLQVTQLAANYTCWYRYLKFGTSLRVALTGLIYRKVRCSSPLTTISAQHMGYLRLTHFIVILAWGSSFERASKTWKVHNNKGVSLWCTIIIW